MRLLDLEPQFLKVDPSDGNLFHYVDCPDDADGVQFLCPVCFTRNSGPVGTHSIICWSPKVPLTLSPGPGRWRMLGAGYADLTLQAGSSSVFLQTAPCAAHFYISNGLIVSAMSNWNPQ